MLTDLRCRVMTHRRTRCRRTAMILAYRSRKWSPARARTRPDMPMCRLHWDTMRHTMKQPEWW